MKSFFTWTTRLLADLVMGVVRCSVLRTGFQVWWSENDTSSLLVLQRRSLVLHYVLALALAEVGECYLVCLYVSACMEAMISPNNF